MLDTGIDIPEIVNLVFFKKVKSKAKFWQMIGRGTRLCPDLFGAGMDKENFLIFDFCSNFEFFRANPRGKEVKNIPSLSEKTFNIKLDLIKELQHLDYQQDKYIAYRNELISELMAEIRKLNRENFVVKQHLKYVDKYCQSQAWTSLGILDVASIKEHLAPLVISHNEDELAKRFDYLIFTIEFADLTNLKAYKAKNNVVKTALLLAQIGTIPQILEQKELIARVQTDDFWKQADIFDYELVREGLRDLIKFIEREHSKIYYTNFTDEILSIKEGAGEFSANSLQSYRKKVSAYLLEHKDHISIHKLRFNKQLTKQDFLALERLLLKDMGTREDYTREFGDTPLTILVRQMVGLDQEAANQAFSEFLNDENLSSQQINFVKRIVDYVVKNGHMQDKTALQEEPFESLGSITELFPSEKAMQIVKVIDSINSNATDIWGA